MTDDLMADMRRGLASLRVPHPHERLKLFANGPEQERLMKEAFPELDVIRIDEYFCLGDPDH